MRRARWAWACIAGVLLCAEAGADDAGDPLLVDARSVSVAGTEIVVEIDNKHPTPFEGSLRFDRSSYSSLFSRGDQTVTELPFRVDPGSHARFTLFDSQLNTGDTGGSVRAVDARGKVLGSSYVSSSGRGYGGFYLFDLDQTSPLVGSLRGLNTSAGGHHNERVEVVTVEGTRLDPHPVLPRTAGGYGDAHLVHAALRTVLDLQEENLIALVDWVAEGHTLALSVTDPGDLRDPRMQALLGGEVGRAPVSSLVLTPAMHGGTDPSDGEVSGPGIAHLVEPTALTASRLGGWAGGNLHDSEYGAIAPYGVGRVVILPFETANAADDPWVIAKLLGLLGDARVHQERSIAAAPRYAYSTTPALTRDLDATNYRPAVIVATLLLLGYVVVTTVFYRRALQRGQLLRPFAVVPATSACAVLLLIGTGALVRGSSADLRRIRLVEAGAGASFATVIEHRSYFTSGNDTLTILGSGALPRVYSTELGVLHQRDGLSFHRSDGRNPWSTVSVREVLAHQGDGNVAIVEQPGGLLVVNHTPFALHDVMLWIPDEGLLWMPDLPPGASAASSDGTRYAELAASTFNSTGMFPYSFTDPRLIELEKRYAVLAEMATQSACFPSNEPALVAITEDDRHPEMRDGLPVTRSKTFFHVVGLGGRP